MNKYSSLPFASSLCGSCSDVCPVKIDIHTQLYKWRQIITRKVHKDKLEVFVVFIISYILAHPFVFRFGGKLANLSLRVLPQAIIGNLVKGWTKERMLPEVPRNTFTQWYKKSRM